MPLMVLSVSPWLSLLDWVVGVILTKLFSITAFLVCVHAFQPSSVIHRHYACHGVHRYNPVTLTDTLTVLNKKHKRRIKTKTAFRPWRMTSSSSSMFSSSTSPPPRRQQRLIQKLLNWFQGDFDNYNQIIYEKEVLNITSPKEGGGHEHIHCTLIPLGQFRQYVLDHTNSANKNNNILFTELLCHPPPFTALTTSSYDRIKGYSYYTDNNTFEQQQDECGAVLAVYYLNGQPNQIFRIRLYTIFQEPKDDPSHKRNIQDEKKDTTNPVEELTNTKDYDYDDDMQVKMKLYLLPVELETQIRQSSLHVSTWEHFVYQYMRTRKNTTTTTTTNNTTIAEDDSFRQLYNCDILWMTQPDPVRHGYLSNHTQHVYFDEDNDNDDKCITTPSNHKQQQKQLLDELNDDVKGNRHALEPNQGIHAYMIYDIQNQGVLVESQTIPGLKIRIQDELSLWKNNLWINDRGYYDDDSVTDASTTKMTSSKRFVYGNWNGIPYQLERVSTFIYTQQGNVADGRRNHSWDDNITQWYPYHQRLQRERIVTNPILEWTLQNASSTCTSLK